MGTALGIAVVTLTLHLAGGRAALAVLTAVALLAALTATTASTSPARTPPDRSPTPGRRESGGNGTH